MKKLQIYRRWLIVTLAIAVFFTGYYTLESAKKMIPDSIMVKAGEGITQNLGMCSVIVEARAVMSNGSSSVKLHDSEIKINDEDSEYTFNNTGTYTAECKLFGLIQLKEVEINVVENQTVIPGGFPAGIYVETDGVMIIGTGTVTGMDNNEYTPAENIVKSGDYVTSINQERVNNKQELIDKINKYGYDEVILGVRRNNEDIKVRLKPVQTGADEYKLGIWIRDNTQGVGMITYVTNDGSYGALGHGITDIDTGYLMEVKNGTLFQTEIVSIIKGKEGNPGELVGMIDYQDNNRIGEITENTNFGLYGKLSKLPSYINQSSAVEIATKEEIYEGNAKIQTYLDGQLKQYDAEILEVNKSSKGNKGIVIRVTDEDLLNKTGGIVQGISGSPILQDGKLIGAVTHVLVNDPTKGYGIFIESMLEHN